MNNSEYNHVDDSGSGFSAAKIKKYPRWKGISPWEQPWKFEDDPSAVLKKFSNLKDKAS